MHIGLVGLGKMGGNMRTRLRNGGIEVTGYDRNPDVSDVAVLADLVEALPAPRVVWVMVPAGAPTDATINALGELLDAGRPRHRRRQLQVHRRRRHTRRSLAEKGIDFLDCGVSRRGLGPGERLRPHGRRRRGARRARDARLRRAAPRGPARGGLRPRRRGRCRPLREDGPQRHRVRPHAGLRRGLRAARSRRTSSPTSTAASRPGPAAPSSAPGCSTCSSRPSRPTPSWPPSGATSSDSGEGRWTVEEAIANAVPMPVISAALFARFASRQDDSPADEGGRGAAQPVRRPRGHRRRPDVRRAAPPR